MDFHNEVAVRWENYVRKGVDKSTIEGIVKKYPAPKNCNIRPPKLNTEIENCLTRDGKKQDQFLVHLQMQMASVLSVMGSIVSKRIEDGNNEVSEENQQILVTLADSGQILCDNVHQVSNHRRFLIKPFLKEEKRKVLSECPIDEFLFGNKLQESIQSDRSVTKTSKELKLDSCFKKSYFTKDPQLGPSGFQRRGTANKTSSSFFYQRPQYRPRRRQDSTQNAAAISKEVVQSPQVNDCPSGLLAKKVTVWNHITNNKIILNWVEDISIQFKKKPVQMFIPKSRFSKSEMPKYKQAKKGAISNCKHKKGEFLSSFFFRQKSCGTYRFILNLKSLNQLSRHLNLSSKTTELY